MNLVQGFVTYHAEILFRRSKKISILAPPGVGTAVCAGIFFFLYTLGVTSHLQGWISWTPDMYLTWLSPGVSVRSDFELPDKPGTTAGQLPVPACLRRRYLTNRNVSATTRVLRYNAREALSHKICIRRKFLPSHDSEFPRSTPFPSLAKSRRNLDSGRTIAHHVSTDL